MRCDLQKYDLKNMKVLIIDDTLNMLTLVKSMLGRIGITQIETVNDAPSGFDRLSVFPADLIVVDWQMEPLDGHDFVRLIRTDGKTKDRKIGLFVTSGLPEQQRVRAAMKAGADDFMAKPFSTNILRDKIYRYIDIQRPDLQERCCNPTWAVIASRTRMNRYQNRENVSGALSVAEVVGLAKASR